MYHKFYNDFCVDSEGNKAKLKYCAAKGDNDNQTFVYNLNGYLENSKGKCLYYDDNGSGPQLGKEIKMGKCPTEANKENYKWTFKKNNRGPANTLAIISNLKNKSTNKEYAIDARKGIKWIKGNGLLNNQIHTNNKSQLTLIEYNDAAKNDQWFSRWFRDFIIN